MCNCIHSLDNLILLRYQWIYRFNTVSIRIPEGFFVESVMLILKSMWVKGPRIAKTTLKNNKVGELTLPDFKTSKTTALKKVWYWYKER